MSGRNRLVERVPGSVTVLGVLFVSMLVAGPALSQTRTEAAKELSKAFSAAAKTAMPAVVSIKVEKSVQMSPSGDGLNNPFGQFDDDFLQRFFGGRMPQRQQGPQKYVERGQGSGFIISEDGYILTNNHVVGDVDKMTVELKDGRKFTNAKLIGTDPESEVAVIKIEGDNFPVLPLGDSDKMEIGDWVIAIGNPFGLSETVTVGVVSAVGRSNVHIADYESFIQTDAAINPGNSGGPLIDLDGKVIGINTAIVSQSGGYMGIGFAIPINMAKAIADQLRDNGKVSRGFLGVYGQDVTADLAEMLNLKESGGVVVSKVEKGSPAVEAGLRSRDVILEMNGKKVQSYDAFRNEIATMRPGSSIRLNILRDDKPLELTVKLGERPGAVAQAQKPAEEPEQIIGLQVQDLTKDLADQLGYPMGEGVVVTAVQAGGPAAEQGIERGDLILSVNNHNVANVKEFGDAMKEAKKGGKVLFLIKREEASVFVVVPLK